MGIKGFLQNGAKTSLDMFPGVNSFPWGNCELQRTDNVCGCKYLSMFSAKWRLLCLSFFQHLFWCVEQNVYKLLMVWSGSWLLRATFCMNKKWKKRKKKLKTCHHVGSIQSPFTWEKNRYPLCQVCRCRGNCCWEFSLSKQTIWIKCNFFLLKVFKYEVSSGDSTSQPVWLIFYFQWLCATLILVTDIAASLL